jgi:outer membrane protein OmpA-like peptidoglycan-associated protein
MFKNRVFTMLAVAMLFAGVTSAGDIGLTSVLYPDGKGVDVPISGTQRAPAAVISAKVKHQSGQSSIQIPYKNLPPAVLFGGDIVSYVVWAVSPDGTFENVGGLANDAEKGTANFSTAKRDFALMISAEPIVTVRTPGELVVFFSGTPSGKDVQPTGFTFGGLSDRDGHITAEHDSIAGMSYKPNKKKPLSLIQAEKAVELLDRFEATKYDADTVMEARNTLAAARDGKGQRQLDASKRTITLAGQALSKTVQMVEAAKEAEALAARRALKGQASDLQVELATVEANLQQTERKLSQTESELARVRASEARLSKKQAAITDRLTEALGQMAYGAKTDRGFVVSLSGVAFPTGQSALKTEGKYVLAKLSGVMLAFDDVKLSIEGHTDSTGSDETNQTLSLARADSVKSFLTEMGVPASIIKTTGYGPDKPLMPNDTAEGRARNRRVEIIMVDTR